MKTPLQIEVDTDSSEQAVPTEDILRGLLLTWQNATLKQNVNAHEVTLKVVGDDEMRDINQRFRHKNYPTNVLSFPSASIPGVPDDHLGDMLICDAVVKQEASEQQLDITAHWVHLAIHGLLHLMGYDHESDDETEEMQALEIAILQELGWSNPYQDN